MATLWAGTSPASGRPTSGDTYHEPFSYGGWDGLGWAGLGAELNKSGNQSNDLSKIVIHKDQWSRKLL